MTETWDEVIEQVDVERERRDAYPLVRVNDPRRGTQIAEMSLADLIGDGDPLHITDQELIVAAENYIVEVDPNYTEVGFLGDKVFVYRPEQQGGNIIIGPLPDFG
jgi:hypothetical protein